VKRTAAGYLQSLVAIPYGISEGIANASNYFLDSYFAKVDQRALMARRVEKWYPSDPDSHIKELWLNCEIHLAVSLNRSYPAFARNLNAWAFTRLFKNYGGAGCEYEIVPFLDQYEFKDMLKGRSSYRVQYEQLSIDLGKTETLPVYGIFFIKNTMDDTHLVVRVDLCYDMPYCSFTVLANPSQQAAAEKFFQDLDASIAANDIYFKKCLSFIKGSLDFAAVTPTSWADIILKDHVKCAIRDNTVEVLKHMDALASIGMCPNRNAILISPPGMAKTTVFRAISGETEGQATRIWCTGKSIEYPEHVTSLFQAARTLAPCIIFIEDMDLFGGNRSGLSGYESRVLNEFLACLDGAMENAGVVVMASTNDIASMDEALVNRPGRFDSKIEIPYPDLIDRGQMLHSFLKKLHAEPDPTVTRETIHTVLELTEGLTGAYIKELAKSTIIRAVAEGRLTDGTVTICSDDLNAAAQQVVSNYAIGKKAQKHHHVEAAQPELMGQVLKD